MIERILVTGGTGKTGRRLVSALQEKGHQPRVASRTPKGPHSIRFSWQDPACFPQAFEGIEAVYLVAPTDTLDSIGSMRPALEAALVAGVTRFILLSASSLDAGGPMMGAVHGWLMENAEEWAVLRPSWFMQNFSEGQHLAPICEASAVYSATGKGKVGFIDAGDIAACAAKLLTAQNIENTDHILTGPRTLSYDNLAELLSQQLGREIQHIHLTTQEMVQRFISLGLPQSYAQTLAGMDEAIAAGSQSFTSNEVMKILGRPPRGFEGFAQKNHEVWQN